MPLYCSILCLNVINLILKAKTLMMAFVIIDSNKINRFICSKIIFNFGIYLLIFFFYRFFSFSFRMQLYSLAFVGLLFSGVALAQNNLEAALFNNNLYGDVSSNAGDSPYWWMSKGSPFKRSYEAGPPQQRFDFAANPFLNSASSSASSNAKLYSAPGYLPPQQQQTIPCNGNGRVCVAKYLCNNGAVDASQVNGQQSQVNRMIINYCSFFLDFKVYTKSHRTLHRTFL